MDYNVKNKPLNADFVLGNMAADLMDIAFDLCNKDDEDKPRFPRRTQRYTDEIVKSTLSVHKNLCIANAIRVGDQKRELHKEIARGESINLSHLVFLAFKKGLISEKQYNRWSSAIKDLYFGILKWTT